MDDFCYRYDLLDDRFFKRSPSGSWGPLTFEKSSEICRLEREYMEDLYRQQEEMRRQQEEMRRQQLRIFSNMLVDDMIDGDSTEIQAHSRRASVSSQWTDGFSKFDSLKDRFERAMITRVVDGGPLHALVQWLRYMRIKWKMNRFLCDPDADVDAKSEIATILASVEVAIEFYEDMSGRRFPWHEMDIRCA